MKTKVSMGLAALGLGAALLTGCSGDDGDGGNGGNGGDGGSSAADDFTAQSADEIVAQAKKDMGELKSVRVNGSIATDNQEIELDMQLNTDGECTGNIGFGGGTTELLGTGGKVWLKPDDAFWKSFAGAQAEQLTQLVGGRWVVMPNDTDGFGEVCDLDELLSDLIDDESDATYEKEAEEEVDGQQAIGVKSTDDEGSSLGYVLVDGPHYLVKIERTEGDEPGQVTFSDFDAELDITPPADSDVVDLNKLAG